MLLFKKAEPELGDHRSEREGHGTPGKGRLRSRRTLPKVFLHAGVKSHAPTPCSPESPSTDFSEALPGQSSAANCKSSCLYSHPGEGERLGVYPPSHRHGT